MARLNHLVSPFFFGICAVFFDGEGVCVCLITTNLKKQYFKSDLEAFYLYFAQK